MTENPKLINTFNGQIIEINCSKFSVGRSLKSSYVLDSIYISRTHFTLEKINENWVLCDNSSNGTLLNNQIINKGSTQQLKDGDIIKLINVNVEFKFEHKVDDTNSITDEQLCEVLDSVICDKDKVNEINVRNDHCYDFQPIVEQIPVSVNEVIIGETEDIGSLSRISIQLPSTSSDSDISFRNKRSSCSDDSPSKKNKSENEETKGDQTHNVAKGKCQEDQTDMFEEEMQCSICSEMFIKAVTLNCCHTFCKYCIEQWKKQQSCCPICRKKISSMAPTLVLDNLIDKHVSQMDEETRKHRKEAIESRILSEKPQKSTAKPVPSTSRNLWSDSSSATSSTTSSSLSSATTTVTTTITTVTITSSDDEDDDEDDDDEYFSDDYDDDYGDYYSYNGVPGKYYGGYGRCYNCNRRGHWANGCPYR